MSSPINNISNKQFHKSDYDRVLKYIVPNLYYEQDNSLKNEEIDIIDQLINCQLKMIGNVTSLVNVSSVEGSVFEDINTPAGISKFFVKQNKLTDIDTNDFERRILVPLNLDYTDFDTSAEFSDYINNTLLPGITLNSPSLDFLEGGSVEDNHEYLINNLSWLYFLNFGSSSLDYSPSAYVHDLLVSKSYQGYTINLNDAMKGLHTYAWRNYETCTPWHSLKIIPDDLRPPSFTVENEYTSGEQQLSRLLTLVDILYSPLYIDLSDVRLKEAITDYLENDYLLEKKILTGPFIKLLKAFSFSFADYTDSVDRLEILNDIGSCPDELLPYLADGIGWRLFGSEPDRWRLQLANAVDIYRTTGTKKSIQFAVDSILGQEVFDVSSSLFELWESYVPHLIYYALATESTLLKDDTTWTVDLANEMGIELYNYADFDYNIRAVVDKIIYDLVLQYRNNFYFNGKIFPIGDVDFNFNYRYRDYPIPPFEEIPYYLNVKVSDDMINSIVDKLVCFGVPESFADQVASFLRSKIFDTDSDISLKNSWLLFTSSLEYPPNWNSIIKDISSSKSQYLPLWNAKSSHFKVIFNAAGFDFSKDSLEGDSGEALEIACQAAKDFSPAHSIPDIFAILSETDYYNMSSTRSIDIVVNRPEYNQLLVSSTAGQSTYGASALAMATYKRGLTATSVDTFSRGGVDELGDALLSPDGTTASLPRRAHRRRNLKYLLPKEGIYARTGDNQPVAWDTYTKEPIPDVSLLGTTEAGEVLMARAVAVNSQPTLYLGLIPSSMQWVPIDDYNNIPAIYDICENLNSSSVYSGLAVSNTYPVRGWRKLGSNVKNVNGTTAVDRYLDRGQLHPFMAALHYCQENAKLQIASSTYFQSPAYYDENTRWMNVLQSHANSATEFSGAFPTSFTDYTDYSFGNEFHKLYYDYTHNFSRHRTSPTILDLNGPTVISHAFGSLLYNSELTETQYPSLITTSLDSAVELRAGQGIFSNSGTFSGSYIASSILNYGTGIREYRNSGVISHVELCQTSGSSPDNSFVVINVDNSGKFGSRFNLLTHENVLIKQSSVDGFGRIIFDISKYQAPTSYYEKTYNFLTPDHDFEMSFKSLISDSYARTFGGGTIGVWIHTKPENGKVWSFTKDKVWVQHSASGITKSSVIGNYSHLFNSSRIDRPDNNESRFLCATHLDRNNSNRANDVVNSILPSDFNDVVIKFNTKNKETIVPADYFESVSNHVHRLNQNYVIEIFTIPVQNDKFTLYYDFNMIDLTLNKWAKPFVTGISNGSNMGERFCKEFRVDLPKDKVLSVLKYFNHINNAFQTTGYTGINHMTGLASRVKSVTQSFYESQGGSRINYVENPSWNSNTKNASNLIEDITIIN